MAVKIIGLIIGLLVLCAGIYYLIKEKDDPESKKIYYVISTVGAIVSVVDFVNKKSFEEVLEISDISFLYVSTSEIRRSLLLCMRIAL